MASLKSVRTALFLVTAFAFGAFASAALAVPDNSWQGTVSSDNLKVYADPSSTSRTVTILTKGVHVTILVEIEALGIQWCRVQLPGDTEALGYVNCSGIQRPTSQVSKAVQKNSVPITARNPAVSAPISLEPKPEQRSAPTTDAAVISAVGSNAESTGALTNSDILSMTKAGLPADVLVAKIKSSVSKFDTSPAALSQLKTGGVADPVILAMVQAPTGAPDDSIVQAAASVPVRINASTAPTTVPTSDGKTRVLVTDSQFPGIAQDKSSCRAYFQVVQTDQRIAGGFVAGMNEPQKTWWNKKGQKKYPGLCWNGSVLSGDKPRFLLIWLSETHSRLVDDSTTQTTEQPVTGTVTDTYGQTVGTIDGTTTTTTTIPGLAEKRWHTACISVVRISPDGKIELPVLT